jgi:hypothetical protein
LSNQRLDALVREDANALRFFLGVARGVPVEGREDEARK